MRRKKHIGDIIEIPTAKGFIYAQCTHTHQNFGEVLRIFKDFYKERPSDFTNMASEKEKFIVLFPLNEAVKQKIFEVVGRAEIPESSKKFPIFRNGLPNQKTGKIEVWWLWDGEKEWKIGKIKKEQRKLPLHEVINDTLLIERLESGWTPETDDS